MRAAICFVWLGIMLHASRGKYSPSNIVQMVALAGVVASMVLVRPRRSVPDRAVQAVLLAAGLVFTAHLVVHPLLSETSREWFVRMRWSCGAAGLLLAIGHFAGRGVLAASGVFFAALLILTPALTPEPAIDVFHSARLAVRTFLSGGSTYGITYPDIYDGGYPYTPGMVYWPGVLWSSAPFELAFGDIRHAYVAALLASAVFLAVLAGSVELGVLWLAFPVSFFVIDRAWVDPLLIAALGGCALALHRGRVGVAAVAIGLALTVKQYAVIAAVPTALIVWREWGWRAFLRFSLISALVAAALVLPVALAEWDGFVRMTITVPLTQPLREDAFSIAAFLSKRGLPGALVVGAAVPPLVLLAIAAWIWRASPAADPNDRVARWAGLLALLHLAVFLTGKQAFVNYYHYAAYMIALMLACELRARARPGASYGQLITTRPLPL